MGIRDRLYGDYNTSQSETFNGGPGNDQIFTIGRGNDTVDAGAGDDFVQYYPYGNSTSVVTLGTGQDTFQLTSSFSPTATVTIT